MKKSILGALAAMSLCFAAGMTNAETIRVGVAAEPYPPFTVPDASGKWSGWEIDFMEAICAEAKFDCVVTPVSWDGIIPALTSNKIDAIIGSMSITEERKKTIDFSHKYYNTPAVVVASKGAGIAADAKGLAGKIVGVQTATIHQVYATKHFSSSASQIKQYQTLDEANQDLVAGRIDAVIADALPLDAFVKSSQGACCELAGTVAHDETVLGAGIGIGLRKGDANRDKFNAAIATIRTNGTYAKFNNEYFEFDIYGE